MPQDNTGSPKKG